MSNNKHISLTVNVSELVLKAAQNDIDDVLKMLDTSIEGLPEDEVESRLKKYGLNTTAREKKKNPVLQLLKQFKNPLSILLVMLAAISIVIKDIETAILISIIVLLSVFLTFFQEYRSSLAAEKLQQMVSVTATVKRKTDDNEQNESKEIPLRFLVPGDIVNLSAGDMIPADIRLISSKDLSVSQAVLTGESLPVDKHSQKEMPDNKNPLSFSNICYMGSNVISGAATAVVIQTGNKTYFGSLAGKIIGQRVSTSFDKGVNNFTWLMIKFILVMGPTVFLINGFSKGNWVEAFFFAIAVTFGLTPEMLPAIVTVNLSQGALMMSKNKVIVKRLNSIQNFGAMDILCSDKTGTLTQDKVVLEKHVDLYGNESEKVIDYAYMNSYYQTGLKNLLDIEILKYAHIHDKLEIDKIYKKIDELPFDFNRKRMSVIIEDENKKHILICKGAIREVFSVSTKGEANNETFNLDKSHLERIEKFVEDLNEDGFRVIAVAYKELTETQDTYFVKDESNLTMIGYIAFLDPPKETAAEAIERLNKNGVEVKILTGDNEIVTRKICKDVGLNIKKIVLGNEIDSMSDNELADTAEESTIFAKLSPDHKERIIKALHLKNHVVGFLGDGINDAPALKVADVGISVDTAVDIAKESADIILLEKSLLILDKGVIEGRRVFGNIVKYIKMSASSNFGNMLSVLGASIFLPFLPMTPIQILSNNLLYDFSQISIPTDNVDKEYLAQPRKWDIGDIKRFMLSIGPISSIFDYVTFLVMIFVFKAWDNPALFHTGWFVESLTTQTIIIHVIRTYKVPFIQSRASLPLIITSVLIISFGLWLPFSPLAIPLGFVKLPHTYFIILFLIILSYFVLTQFVKTWFVKKYGAH